MVLRATFKEASFKQPTVPFKMNSRDFPGGPVVKSLPSNAKDAVSNPGWGTKIPHAVGQRTYVPQGRPSTVVKKQKKKPKKTVFQTCFCSKTLNVIQYRNPSNNSYLFTYIEV